MHFGRVSGSGDGPRARGREREAQASRRAHDPDAPPLLRLKQPSPGASRRQAPAIAPTVLNVSLPPQEELLRRFLRPRQAVDIILNLDLDQDFIDVRHSAIEDVLQGGRLVMAQTDPPLLRSHCGQMAEITLLSRQKGPDGPQWLRLGYRTPIREVIANHRLRAGVYIPAIVVDAPQRLEPSTARMAPRLPLTPDMDLRLFLMPHRVEVAIQDLSAGGVFFSHEAWMNFNQGSRLRLGLETGKLWLDLEGDVVRGEPVSGHRNGTAVRFEDLDPQTRRQIRQLTLEINRHLHAQRLEGRTGAGGRGRRAGL
ncbi:MAG: PilZ domain-containing protein [Pseudomonadota bacterium]